jgi:hypothetical protein
LESEVLPQTLNLPAIISGNFLLLPETLPSSRLMKTVRRII